MQRDTYTAGGTALRHPKALSRLPLVSVTLDLGLDSVDCQIESSQKSIHLVIPMD